MAHSFISAKNASNTERSVAIPDGAIHLFMYFFNEVAATEVQPKSESAEIYESYRTDVIEYPWSCFDAKLQQIPENPELKSWYLSILSKVSSHLDLFGGHIDHNYLNQIPVLVEAHGGNQAAYPQQFPVSEIKNLINDIYWVLNESGYIPSGHYKFFEEDIA